MKKHFIKLQGITLCYYTLGAGIPLLFLHGGRLRALTFKKDLEILSRYFLIIAPDIPGHGESSTPPKAWSLTDYAKFFDLFLKQLDVKNVIVVGYSRGGGIALYLSEITRAISNTILIDPAGVTSNTPNFLIADIKRLNFYITHPQYYKVFFLLINEFMYYQRKHFFDIHYVLKSRQLARSLNFKSQHLKKIPTYILWGEDDWVLPIDHGYQLKKHLPHSKLEVVEGNHDWMFYQQGVFTKKILSYLNKRKQT